MTLKDYIEQNFKHVTLSTKIVKGDTVLRVPELNVDLTVGLISTNNKEEFQKLCFNYVPVGTIINELDQDWYDAKLLMCRNLLTKELLTNPRAKQYLDILARRDKDRWSDQAKKTEVKASSNGINLEFIVRE